MFKKIKKNINFIKPPVYCGNCTYYTCWKCLHNTNRLKNGNWEKPNKIQFKEDCYDLNQHNDCKNYKPNLWNKIKNQLTK